MENNPKKSKAFIITFILILLLLIAGYYLFKNRENLFGTKGSLSTSKIFAPLLGTSKSKDLKTIEDPNATKVTDTGSNTVVTPAKKTGTVITDASGNKLVLAEAGEMLKKGDVLYIASFNANNQPIVMKAIANDRAKSLVFGVAAEDMDKGELGTVIIEGILTGITTNKKEGTVWAVNNTLYLSDKIYGGMTKNSPVTPSFSVPVASVLKVDAINGSIKIGNIANNKSISAKDRSNLNSYNSNLLTNSIGDIQDYWNSIFGDGTYGGYNYVGSNYNNGVPPINPITGPGTVTGPNANTCGNGADNPTLCTTKNGACLNKATNPPTCTIIVTTIADNSCKILDENPLTYTVNEQRQLDELLRKFYLISSTLKTKSDLALVYRELDEYKALVDQVKNITTQCYKQIDEDPSYTGPKTRFGNPWFKYTDRGSYLPSTTEITSSCKYCEPNDMGSSYYCTGDAADSSIPYCEPDGKERRASGNYSRYYNAFGVSAFGATVYAKNGGNPLSGWQKAALTAINPLYGGLSWLWKTKYFNPGPTVQKTDLQDYELILNVW